jgi:hypothetical protein
VDEFKAFVLDEKDAAYAMQVAGGDEWKEGKVSSNQYAANRKTLLAAFLKKSEEQQAATIDYWRGALQFIQLKTVFFQFFTALDLDGNGVVSAAEVAKAMKMDSTEQASGLMSILGDANGDKLLSKAEWTGAFKQLYLSDFKEGNAEKRASMIAHQKRVLTGLKESSK